MTLDSQVDAALERLCQDYPDLRITSRPVQSGSGPGGTLYVASTPMGVYPSRSVSAWSVAGLGEAIRSEGLG
jgi:hypothetical protein